MMRVSYECPLKLPIEEKKARVCSDIKKCKELHLIRKKIISMYQKIDSHYQGLFECNVWLKKTTAKPVAVPHTADIADATDIADTAMIRIDNDDTSTTIAMEFDDICYSNRRCAPIAFYEDLRCFLLFMMKRLHQFTIT